MDGWMDGWWKEGKTGLRIAYSNQNNYETFHTNFDKTRVKPMFDLESPKYVASTKP